MQFFESWAEFTGDGGWDSSDRSDRSWMSNSLLAILPGTTRCSGFQGIRVCVRTANFRSPRIYAGEGALRKQSRLDHAH